ncbi:adenylate kinase [Streptomyces spiralis]|uniref:adenylate kinase n=1 Tax=Streptomyces spiralis TaxID=66376 RepID=UPI0033F959D0
MASTSHANAASASRPGARLLIVGPPGAGKGTQAARIAAALRIPAISTGDIFRENIRNGTPLGARVQHFLDAGDLVPDTLTNELVADRMRQPDAEQGFLLDGFPRTPEQADFLDAHLAQHGGTLDAVIRLVADNDEVIIRRLVQRGLELGRSDDTEDTIRHRLEVYTQQTAPLIRMYEQRGLLAEVDSLGPIGHVTARTLAALADRGIIADEPANHQLADT